MSTSVVSHLADHTLLLVGVFQRKSLFFLVLSVLWRLAVKQVLRRTCMVCILALVTYL